MMRHFFMIQYLAQPKRSRDDSGLTPYRFFKQDKAIAFSKQIGKQPVKAIVEKFIRSGRIRA